MPIYRLENAIQNYEWGSYTFIANLLHKTSSSFLPQAELWMGAHPKAPSTVLTDNGKYSLVELIKNNPIDVLGEDVFNNFGTEMPYLFKIMAVDKPLSVQVHPNKEQAIAGFDKENDEQKPIDCFERNYKDKNHKIECVCALSPLWSLNGFRNILEMQLLIKMVCPDVISELFKTFVREPNEIGLELFLRKLLLLPKRTISLAVYQALIKAKALEKSSLIFKWVCRLADMYPNEISVFAPIILNLIQFKPGQAMLIREGVPHTYMGGIALEVMVNSDNVLRAGLTNKYVDISEAMNILEFVCKPVCFIGTQIIRPCETSYKTDIIEFSLSIINVNIGQIYIAPKKRSVEILLCTQGKGIITDILTGLTLGIKKGDSFLVTASVMSYSIHGSIKIFKASVPLIQ